MEYKVCPSCGKKNSASEICCTGCYTPLTGVRSMSSGSSEAVETVRCPACGSQTRADRPNCSVCGSSLNTEPSIVDGGESWSCSICGFRNSYEQRRCAQCSTPLNREGTRTNGRTSGNGMLLPWAFSSEKLELNEKIVTSAFEKVCNSPYLQRIPERWEIAQKIVLKFDPQKEFNAYATIKDDKPHIYVYCEFLRVAAAVCAAYLVGERGRDLLMLIDAAMKGPVMINGEVNRKELDTLLESYMAHVIAHEAGHLVKRHLQTPYVSLLGYCQMRANEFFEYLPAELQRAIVEYLQKTAAVADGRGYFEKISAQLQNNVLEVMQQMLAKVYIRDYHIHSREQEREADMEAIQIIREMNMADYFLEGQLLVCLSLAKINHSNVYQALANNMTHPAGPERLITFLESNRAELLKSLISPEDLEVYTDFAREV